MLARMIWNFDMELDSRCVNWADQECFLLWQKTPLFIKLRLRVVGEKPAL